MGKEVPDTTSGFEMPNESQNGSEKAHRRTTLGASSRIAARGDGGCDAPSPGGPLTTRQPAETLVNVG